MRCAHGQQVYSKLWHRSFTLRIMSSRNRMGWSLHIWMGMPFHQEKRLRWMTVAWGSPTKAPLLWTGKWVPKWHGCICKRQRWPQTIFWRWTKRFIVISYSYSIHGLHCRGGVDGFLFGCLAGHYSRGLSNWSYGRFDPIVEFMRPVPSLTLIPLMIIWFGIGKTSKIITLFLVALLIMVAAKF